MAEKKKVFIYARRSSEKNKERSISIENQIDKIQTECRKRGYEIVEVFQDNKSSFVAWKRDDFSRMLMEIKKRNIKNIGEKIDCVYVFMASRLARNFEEGDILRNYIMENVIEVLSMTEAGIDCSTLWGKKVLVEMMTDAVFDSLEKSRNGTINMDTAYTSKWSLSGKLCRWYIKVGRGDKTSVEIDTKYRINEAVITCFELYSTGEYNYENLAEKLNKMWFRKYETTKHDDIVSPFIKKDIENMLTTEFYWGRVVVRYKKPNWEALEHLIEKHHDLKREKDSVFVDYTKKFEELGTFKPLISKKLFDKCRDIREWKKSWPKWNWFEDGEIYVWKGIVRCPCRMEEWKDINDETITDLRVFTAETKKKRERSYQYYRCSCNDKTACDNAFVSGIALEDLIFEEVISKLVFNEQELEILQFAIQKKLEQEWKIEEDMGWMLRQNIGRLEWDLERTLTVYVDETSAPLKSLLSVKLTGIQKDIEAAKNQLDNLPNVSEWNMEKIQEPLTYAKELATNFKSFPPRKKRWVAKAIFKHIIVHQWRIVNFRLKPLFQGIFHREVLTHSKKKKGWGKKSSNSTDGKGKPLLASLCVFDPYGWGWGIRTPEWRSQSPLPYHLANPQQMVFQKE